MVSICICRPNLWSPGKAPQSWYEGTKSTKKHEKTISVVCDIITLTITTWHRTKTDGAALPKTAQWSSFPFFFPFAQDLCDSQNVHL